MTAKRNDFNEEAASWEQGYFQGHITAKIDALCDRVEVIAAENGKQWDTIGEVRKERTDCRVECDKQTKSLKIWSAVSTAIVAVCTAVILAIAKLFGYNPNP